MESLGPGELKHGITQTSFFIKVRLARYLEILPLGLTMTVRPHPDMVKLKYGNTHTPLSGETHVWNPSDLLTAGTSRSGFKICQAKRSLSLT